MLQIIIAVKRAVFLMGTTKKLESYEIAFKLMSKKMMSNILNKIFLEE